MSQPYDVHAKLEERREKAREYARQYRAANPEKLQEYRRQRYAANQEKSREQTRQYYAANQEKRREYQRQYRAANPAKIQGYRAANQEKIRERNRRELEANPEKARAARLRRFHGMSPEDWAELWAAQQGLCYLCEEPMTPDVAHLDHDHSCCPPSRSCRTCRRGLTHRACNHTAGAAGDDPGKLARIAKNLRVAKRDAAERIAAKPGQPAMVVEDAS